MIGLAIVVCSLRNITCRCSLDQSVDNDIVILQISHTMNCFWGKDRMYGAGYRLAGLCLDRKQIFFVLCDIKTDGFSDGIHKSTPLRRK